MGSSTLILSKLVGHLRKKRAFLLRKEEISSGEVLRGAPDMNSAWSHAFKSVLSPGVVCNS